MGGIADDTCSKSVDVFHLAKGIFVQDDMHIIGSQPVGSGGSI